MRKYFKKVGTCEQRKECKNSPVHVDKGPYFVLPFDGTFTHPSSVLQTLEKSRSQIRVMIVTESIPVKALSCMEQKKIPKMENGRKPRGAFWQLCTLFETIFEPEARFDILIRKRKIYWTHAVKCPVEEGKRVNAKVVRCCMREFLSKELEKLQPEVVLFITGQRVFDQLRRPDIIEEWEPLNKIDRQADQHLTKFEKLLKNELSLAKDSKRTFRDKFTAKLFHSIRVPIIVLAHPTTRWPHLAGWSYLILYHLRKELANLLS